MRPRVSAIIGCWNNEATLASAIESILGQTLRDLELIVVDDGSTDASAAVARGFEDPRVRVLELGRNVGIARSLNAAAEHARGDAIAFQDADDRSLPERLERQLAVLDARREVAVVGCRMREEDPAGRPLRTRLPWAVGDVTEQLARFNPVPGTCSMVRADVFAACGGFDPGFRYAADYELWTRIATEHRVHCLPDELAVRVLGTANAGARRERAQIAETLRVRARALRRDPAVRRLAGIARPALSYALPLSAKRAWRRARGMAP